MNTNTHVRRTRYKTTTPIVSHIIPVYYDMDEVLVERDEGEKRTHALASVYYSVCVYILPVFLLYFYTCEYLCECVCVFVWSFSALYKRRGVIRQRSARRMTPCGSRSASSYVVNRVRSHTSLYTMDQQITKAGLVGFWPVWLCIVFLG